MTDTVGLTKDAGWQFGVRRTIRAEVPVVWELLFSESIAKLWLPSVETDFSTFKPQSHIRTKWQLTSWSNRATLQMRVIPNKNKTVLAFHFDRLLDPQQRHETKVYWTQKITTIVGRIHEELH